MKYLYPKLSDLDIEVTYENIKKLCGEPALKLAQLGGQYLADRVIRLANLCLQPQYISKLKSDHQLDSIQPIKSVARSIPYLFTVSKGTIQTNRAKRDARLFIHALFQLWDPEATTEVKKQKPKPKSQPAVVSNKPAQTAVSNVKPPAVVAPNVPPSANSPSTIKAVSFTAVDASIEHTENLRKMMALMSVGPQDKATLDISPSFKQKSAGSTEELKSEVPSTRSVTTKPPIKKDPSETIKPAIVLVDDVFRLVQAVSIIGSEKIISFDCEMTQDDGRSQLALLQISTTCLSVFLFDMMFVKKIIPLMLESFKAIFESPNIKKIVHDGRQDVQLLKSELDISVKNVLDTQVQYSLLEKMRGEETRRVSLSKLIERYCPQHLTISQRFQHEPRLWEKRPLTSDMIDYASNDAKLLFEISRRIEDEMRAYQDELSCTNCETIEEESCFTRKNAPKNKILSPTAKREGREGRDENVEDILRVFPPNVANAIRNEISKQIDVQLNEIVVDWQRLIQLRFSDGGQRSLHELGVVAQMEPFVKELMSKTNTGFSSDNRIGLQDSLHRISAIKSKQKKIVGLTYRIGRHVRSSAKLLTDVIHQVTKKHQGEPQSVLLVGPPGVGKTTLLREFSRTLCEEHKENVMIVDTSNEIGGDGDTMHHCVGEHARRMPVQFHLEIPVKTELEQVANRENQHDIMIEAVQNHTPTVLATAAKTISQRGIGLIGTAHGTSIDSLMKNPDLIPLLGGLQAVILSDKSLNGSTQGGKTRLERVGAPTFPVVVEIVKRNMIRIHHDVAETIDKKLAGKAYEQEIRWDIGMIPGELTRCRWVDERDPGMVYATFEITSGQSKRDWIEELRDKMAQHSAEKKST
ncbi:ATPase-like protein [Planoprotostelium fungivorum]|uniref:ATPase-like protein n=1 Tax=Planoprotostelium fungivorum TaxID=1890364 RepID=A0A2P6MWA6_9EUKA|nr:ATPase-like protein [Planoprotostelium fungivorum]